MPSIFRLSQRCHPARVYRRSIFRAEPRTSTESGGGRERGRKLCTAFIGKSEKINKKKIVEKILSLSGLGLEGRVHVLVREQERARTFIDCIFRSLRLAMNAKCMLYDSAAICVFIADLSRYKSRAPKNLIQLDFSVENKFAFHTPFPVFLFAELFFSRNSGKSLLFMFSEKRRHQVLSRGGGLCSRILSRIYISHISRQFSVVCVPCLQN